MKHCLALTCLMVLAAPVAADEVSFDWDYTLSANTAQHRDSALLGKSSDSSSETVDALIDLQLEGYGLTGLIAAKGNQVYSSDSSESYKGELIIQELFWQGITELFDASIDFTLGKVRLDWGVGYGYRPLDVFKPYRRNPVGIQVEEGTGVAMASYFDMSGEWSLVYSDSSWTQQDGSQLEQASEQQGIGLRRYVLSGDSEWQGLAYYDDVRQGLFGGSFVTVLSDAWSLHSSALYQRKYLSYVQGESHAPVSLAEQTDAVQALVGLNWANAVGNNIILEYWYDSRSWSQSEWNKAFERVASLSNNHSLKPLASSYAQGLNNANLVQHNVMFHWSLDSSSWSQWSWSNEFLWLNKLTPTFDLLYSPKDQGVIATQWLDYRVYDSGSASFSAELAARFMTGDSESVYANLSDKRMIFINLKGKF
ncbi:hypothetical protein [Vibrio europaeus]|uniref:hypothetical protein n=1 Tax=Vibrio europaeus TaxID=300876 RepID=UPI00233F14F0|nr:hypothetical protein [Vibrio europaeus]MDC5855413.1 hypothetical protein [Vibrio europaeus]